MMTKENILRTVFGAITLVFLVTLSYTVFSRASGRSTLRYDISQVAFDKETYPLVIIGGGVGGLTASVYSSLANIQTLLVEGEVAGGLLTQSLSVRNWPGELDAPGSVITDKLRSQSVKRGTHIVQEKAIKVDTHVWPFQVTLADIYDQSKIRVVKALSMIVAMGAFSNYLGIPGEKKYWSRGVTNCAVCEGALYKDKVVCVIGGGDSAIEEAHYLSNIARKVYLFVRKDKLRAVDNRKDEVLARHNVEVVFNTSLTAIEGDDKAVTQVQTVNNVTGQKQVYKIDGVFLAIGFTPNTEILSKQLTLTKRKYIALTHDQETSVKGVFAIGDIVDPQYKQAVTAAGDGCRAALQVNEFLKTINYHATMSDDSSVEKQVAPTKTVDKELPVPVSGTEQAVTLPVPGVVHEVTSVQEYNKILGVSQVPVIVDFFATWCGPCKMILPLYKKLAREYSGKALFLKVNIDNLPVIAQQNNVRGVPTFSFVRSGEEKDRHVGTLTKKQFKKKIDGLL